MAVQQKSKKNVQKQFFEVSAPLTSAKISLYAASMDELEGKKIRLDMTRNLRGKNLELIMKIKKEGDNLVAEPVGSYLLGSYIRRVFRNNTDYVEDSFKVKCKDSEVVVKPFLITRKKVPRALRNALRIAAKDFIVAYVTTRTNLELFSDLLTGKIQKELSIKLKKLYPLALCEIRQFEVVQVVKKFN